MLTRPKRNQMCPCGSGQKFKKCCARPVPEKSTGPTVVCGIDFPELAVDVAAHALASVATEAPVDLEAAD